MRLLSPAAGLFGAAVASLILCLVTLWQGKSVKILELGSLVLFGLLGMFTVAVRPPWTVATVRLAVDGGLLVIILLSLSIRKPFTLQYARERVAEQYWTSPRFFSTSVIISAVWAGAFAVSAISDALMAFVAAIPLWVDVALSLLGLVGAAQFTRWYSSKRKAVS